MSFFHALATLLASALAVLGFVQAHPELPPQVQQNTVQVVQQAIDQASSSIAATNSTSCNVATFDFNNTTPGQNVLGSSLTFKNGVAYSADTVDEITSQEHAHDWEYTIAKTTELFTFGTDVIRFVHINANNLTGSGEYENIEAYTCIDGTVVQVGQWTSFGDTSVKQVGQQLDLQFDSEYIGASSEQSPITHLILNWDPKMHVFKDHVSTSTNESDGVVPGMSKYTDPDFGFSFWYPSGWTMEPSTDANSAYYDGGTVVKSITINPPPDPVTDLGDGITIEEFTSPNREITFPPELCSPMQGYVKPSDRYYFDTNTHTWMDEVGAQTNESERDGSQYFDATTTKAANVSVNTMGGLHILSAGCRGNVIPLSAHNFLIFTTIWNSSYNYFDLANTIVATNPSVANPVNATDQIQAIVREGIQYDALGTKMDDGIWIRYNNAVYNASGLLVPGADLATFHSVFGLDMAADRNAVYDMGVYGQPAEIVPDADPATFTAIKGPDGNISSAFRKDKNHVWYESEIIPDADPTTFQIVINQQQLGDDFFQKDATHVWHEQKLIPNADPASFSIINQTDVWQAGLFEKDASHVWYQGLLIPGADSKSFVVDEWGNPVETARMHDVEHTYELSDNYPATSTVKIDGGNSVMLQ